MSAGTPRSITRNNQNPMKKNFFEGSHLTFPSPHSRLLKKLQRSLYSLLSTSIDLRYVETVSGTFAPSRKRTTRRDPMKRYELKRGLCGISEPRRLSNQAAYSQSQRFAGTLNIYV
jgi:hypothetical protein